MVVEDKRIAALEKQIQGQQTVIELLYK